MTAPATATEPYAENHQTLTEDGWTIYQYDFWTTNAASVAAIVEWCGNLPNQGQYEDVLTIHHSSV